MNARSSPSLFTSTFIKKSNLKWKNIDITHLTRYVAVNTNRSVIERDKLEEVVPIPVRTTTLNSLTNPSKTAKETEGRNQFTPPARNPTEMEIKKLIGHAVAVGIHACMENHYYKIEDNIRSKAKTQFS